MSEASKISKDYITANTLEPTHGIGKTGVCKEKPVQWVLVREQLQNRALSQFHCIQNEQRLFATL